MSPDPYNSAFKEELDLRKYDYDTHHTSGLSFVKTNGQLLLAAMSPHTPGSRIPRWQSNLRGAWLIKINDNIVSTIANAQRIFKHLHSTQAKLCTLLFAHPEINRNISNNGLPIMHTSDFTQLTLDQLNNRTNLAMQQASLIDEQQHT